jgi:hypothetical protein
LEEKMQAVFIGSQPVALYNKEEDFFLLGIFTPANPSFWDWSDWVKTEKLECMNLFLVKYHGAVVVQTDDDLRYNSTLSIEQVETKIAQEDEFFRSYSVWRQGDDDGPSHKMIRVWKKETPIGELLKQKWIDGGEPKITAFVEEDKMVGIKVGEKLFGSEEGVAAPATLGWKYAKVDEVLYDLFGLSS